MSEAAATVDLEPVEQIHAALAERISQGQLRLPLLPQVAQQVLALTSDPEADASTMATLIQQDQALATQVLKIANSPAYMPRSPIVSLQQGVAWLGVKMLGDLALMVSIENGVFHIQGYESEVTALWRHALATGLYAKEIARQNRNNVESAFLCGLLHTIGKPVVLEAVLDIQRQMELTIDWAAIVVLMDAHHAQVGAFVVESWGLPDLVKEAILYYSDYRQAPAPSLVAMVTCLADRLASHTVGNDQGAVHELPVIEDLNLYPDDVEALLAHGETILQVVDAMVL